MLVGNLFGFTWAGGDGYRTHSSGFVGAVEYKRGQTIDSGDSFLLLQFCDALIYFDVSTHVTLVDGRQDRCAINVAQGRIIVKGKIEIQTRNIAAHINGTSSFVHYSWLDDIEVATISGSLLIDVPGRHQLNLESDAVKLHTLAPYTQEKISFNPATSAAADFYKFSLP